GSAGASLNDWKQIKGKVIVTPFFNQEAIDDFFSDIDVLLFPSQWKESFGLTIREAMLRDVWVIATDCGGPTEDVVEGINGNITPFEDQEAFKLAIENILNNPHFLSAYKNPHKEKILLIDDQAKHLQRIYTSMLNCKI
ncbi:MAG: glycosyltransferase, partial [Burkholderiales bacterium]